ncbi:MAG: MSMEG_4193 family putative phosphomutase [Chloroflexi bacterium]|nr:MSMEG_4193 family putative phosphomutase [Chloroflexota bacterium]
MPTLFLIRHAENEYLSQGRLAGRLPGVHLNEEGREQAHALADSLSNAPVEAVYVSPLERTMETAQPIARALGLEVIPEPGLLEVDFGEWQGKTLEQLRRRKLWQTVQNSPSQMCFPGGESFADAQRRIVEVIERLSGKHRPEALIVCVSHGDPIKLALAHYLEMPIDLFQRLMIAPASISTLHIGEGWARVVNINHYKNDILRAEHQVVEC